ncbi:Na+/H+ antiporter NhaA [Tautonia rosea]|uniref:Na+/H+ antiporter NhaA n=1 Tax=Tautonia rosea TaxID=2728037 RepID=UPI001475694F|nr:Na+/H+ antiporter NhaA [Tautonia rosea]
MHLPPRSKGKIEIHSRQSPLARRVGLRALTFIHTAEAGGAALFLAATIAIFWANSPWRDSYETIFHTPMEVTVGAFALAPPSEQANGSGEDHAHDDQEHGDHEGEPVNTLVSASIGGASAIPPALPAESASTEAHDHADDHRMNLHHWINDGLMVLFFFVVGLEIKRELVLGELASFRKAALPAALALGGMIIPAAIYALINMAPGGVARGWGVPMATDIAFAIGVLALLGNRVPNTIRVLLLAFAIVDDIGAIMVIALFYTEQISLTALMLAVAMVGVVVIMQRIGVLDIFPYILVGGVFWALLLSSGVHATIAGVVLGLMTPSVPWLDMQRYSEELDRLQAEYNEAMRVKNEDEASFILGKIEHLTQMTESILDRLIRFLHPWTAFVVLPIFALANAGVVINAESLNIALGSPVLWGVALGLFLGKPIGTTLMAWLCVKSGLVSLPEGTNFKQIFGIGMLGAIGFTVALFITDLAFITPQNTDAAKLGILMATLAASAVGLIYLRAVLPERFSGEMTPAEAAHH